MLHSIVVVGKNLHHTLGFNKLGPKLSKQFVMPTITDHPNPVTYLLQKRGFSKSSSALSIVSLAELHGLY